MSTDHAVPRTTRAVTHSADGFAESEVPLEPLGPRDLLVEIHAVSVNPVDTKVAAGAGPDDEPRVLGWDAAGVVVATGPEAQLFVVGDEVVHAGSIARAGSDADLQVVDERIVGPRPATLDPAEAAALPLTSITAWECLFDRLRLTADSTGTLLVVGGAGGVGSMVIQMASALTGLRVVATAGRPESAAWVRQMGADEVVGRDDLVADVLAVAPDGVDHVVTAFSEGYVEAFAELLVPRGDVVAIDDPVGLDLLPLKAKSQGWLWELMFTRPLHEPGSTHQHEILTEVARLVDAGTLRTTLTTRLDGLTPETVADAHDRLSSSRTIGKVVLVNRPG